LGTPQEEADWLARLRVEARELDVKRQALAAYLAKDAPGSSHLQTGLMHEQITFMDAYFDILARRIAYAALTGGH